MGSIFSDFGFWLSIAGIVILCRVALLQYKKDKLDETKSGQSKPFLIWSIAGLALTAVATIKQNLEKADEKKVNIENRRNSDSTVTARVKLQTEANSKKLFNDITTAFHRQKLELDTANKRVLSMLDLSKRTTIVLPQKDPTLVISNMVVEKPTETSFHMDIIFQSLSAGSTNFNVKVYGLAVDTAGYDSVLLLPNLLEVEEKIGPEVMKPRGFTVNRNIATITNIYIYMVGSYKNFDNQGKYGIDDVFIYTVSTKESRVMRIFYAKKVIERLRRAYKNSNLKM